MAHHRMIDGYAYSACRLLGHSWEVVPSDWTPAFGVPMTCRCDRCSIERRDSVNRRTGAVESRRYVYPRGYQFARDEGGPELPHRSDFRVAWLEQQITETRKRRARTKARRAA